MSELMRFLVFSIFVVFTLTVVSCWGQVTGSIGEDVLLPCVYRGASASVFWRDKSDNNVLNIKQSKPDYSSQHQNFTGRVESFPDQYHKGNFSIVLKKVQQSDSGRYYCLVSKVNFQQRVQLIVSGERAAAATTAAPGSSGHRTAVILQYSLHLLCVLLSVLVSSFN